MHGLALVARWCARSPALRRGAPLRVERALTVGPAIGVRTEEISLGLDQVGRRSEGPVAVEPRQGRCERGYGYASVDASGDDVAPTQQRLAKRFDDRRSEHEVRRRFGLSERVANEVEDRGRMMHPPRQIVARSSSRRAQPCSSLPRRSCSKPWAYATIFPAYRASRSWSVWMSMPVLSPGEDRTAAADRRSLVSADSDQAWTASAITVEGDPRSNESIAVRRPVPSGLRSRRSDR